jgi:hypothetical protein
MLRNAVLAIAMLMTAAGLIIAWTGNGGGLSLAIWGGIIAIAVLFERWRYRRPAATSGNWQATGEKFIDPESGEAMEVLYDPATGERRYVSSEQQG